MNEIIVLESPWLHIYATQMRHLVPQNCHIEACMYLASEVFPLSQNKSVALPQFPTRDQSENLKYDRNSIN